MRNLRNVLFAAIVLALPSAVPAQVLRVTIPVDGALCGFCMAGIRERFREMQPGLVDYELSVRKRQADLRLDGTQHVDVEALRRVIRDYGYTPREALVTVRGIPRLEKRSGKSELWLHGVGVDQTFRIAPADPATDQQYQELFRMAERGSEVTLTGKLRSDAETLSLTAEAGPLAGQDRQKSVEEPSRAPETEVFWAQPAPGHVLEHRRDLALSKEQLAALEAIAADVETRRKSAAGVADHCGNEIGELLAQRLTLTAEDEKRIRHELEEIGEARKELVRAEGEAALAAWKLLEARQRQRWLELVAEGESPKERTREKK